MGEVIESGNFRACAAAALKALDHDKDCGRPKVRVGASEARWFVVVCVCVCVRACVRARARARGWVWGLCVGVCWF